mgnify:CR=1 FL=1
MSPPPDPKWESDFVQELAAWLLVNIRKGSSTIYEPTLNVKLPTESYEIPLVWLLTNKEEWL